ncbi:protein of unknown function [Methylorubrum extorquens]|uniref:HpcH/HpaI aldolase/citrate lyase domain-containing protein n=1 Tax=Methylorubrum extorquens TaxID=408 RepID=A0A2N9ALJ8_METEX|nr:protein of unknown function [Methylorubrum extorquens]
MKLPRRFFQPLAAGAPEPFRELPIKLERMIHFVPPHNEKVRARVPELAKTVDVVLGNLEDAVPADQKEAARKGFVEMARATDFAASGTGLWTRINALNSPWILDDLFTIVAEVGAKLDVVMVPKVEGPLGHPLHRPVAGPARGAPRRDEADPRSRHPRDRGRRGQRRRHRLRLAAHARHEPRTRRSRGLPRHEDHPRWRRPPGLPRPVRSQGRCRAGVRPAGSVALHHRQDGRCLHGQRHQGVLRPVRRLLRLGRLRGAVPQRLPDGLRRRLDPASEPSRPGQDRVRPPTRPR